MRSIFHALRATLQSRLQVTRSKPKNKAHKQKTQVLRLFLRTKCRHGQASCPHCPPQYPSPLPCPAFSSFPEQTLLPLHCVQGVPPNPTHEVKEKGGGWWVAGKRLTLNIYPELSTILFNILEQHLPRGTRDPWVCQGREFRAWPATTSCATKIYETLATLSRHLRDRCPKGHYSSH